MNALEDEDLYELDDLTECRNCGAVIGTWVHSQMGPIKARAWTHERPGDPRDNQVCDTDDLTYAAPFADDSPDNEDEDL